MKRALLISIHPEWAEKILKGEKTIEIRTWIPKDYAGWVYVYITLGELIERHWKKINPIDRQIILYGVGVKKSDLSSPHSLNGKVAFRFFVWRESFVKIIWEDDHYFICSPMYDGAKRLLNSSCLTKEELYKYGRKRDLYAWHIAKLEIFDKPKELSEFYRGYDILGNEPKPYLTHQITKAPQKCAWVYIDEK